MTFKIVRYEKLPDWAKHCDDVKKGLYILTIYPRKHRASTYPFTLRNFIRAIKELRINRVL